MQWNDLWMTLRRHRLRAIAVAVLVVVAGAVALAQFGGIGATGGAPGGSAAGGATGKGPGGKTMVETQTVARESIRDELVITGEFRAVNSVALRAEMAGRIQRLPLDDGQAVKAGQVLAELDNELLQAETQQARAERDLAEANYRRAQNLFGQQFISQGALDEAAANAAVARAKARAAEARLARSRVVAPFAGRVGISSLSVGAYVREGDVIATIDNNERLYFDFRVPERYLGMIREGQEVGIEVAGEASPRTTRVSAINSRIDAEGRFLALRSEVDNREGSLKSGLFARARLTLVSRPDALVVSEEALVGERNGFFVWRVNDGKVEKVSVGLGVRSQKTVEIVSGLAEGDEIVTAGQLKIRAPGQAVTVRSSAPRDRGPETKPSEAKP